MWRYILVERFVKYSCVGALGFLVNLFIFFLCQQMGIHYLLAAGLSFLVAASHNFLWNYFWTFKNKRMKNSKGFSRYVRFIGIGAACLGINVIILYVLVANFFLPKFYAQVISLLTVSAVSFYLQNSITFAEEKEKVFANDAGNYPHIQ